MNDFIAVAFVNKPQGIKGDLKVEVLLDNPDNFAQIREVYDNKQTKYNVENIYKVGGQSAIHLSGIDSIEQATPFKNQYIYVTREVAKKLVGENRYFLADLIGKIAVLESGKTLGIIDDIDNYGASDIVFIKSKEYSNLSFANVGDVITNVDENKVTLNDEAFNTVCVYDEQE